MWIQEERYADLERPAEGAVWEVPFVVITFVPSSGGGRVDAEKAGFTGTVRQLRERILRSVRVTKWMLEESSRFHGYKDQNALPSLGYRCVRYLTIYGDIPRGRPTGGKNEYFPDYGKIVEDAGGKELVNSQGVKEFWVYQWHHGSIAPIETNLSSAVSGDISNSDRQNDLPLYDRSYMVVGANFNRGPDKHVHNIGHQMEALLTYVNQRQDGNTKLFHQQFCGNDDKGKFQPGRCGNCHFPPNATKDYDYFNPAPARSDIEDWNPAGTGEKKQVSFQTWERLPYRAPTGDRIRQPGTILEDDAWWYLYWFQSFPGQGAEIPHPNGTITNWWRFLADWDGALREGYGLWQPKTPLGPEPGELELEGTVERQDGPRVTVLAETLREPGKATISLNPPRPKVVENVTLGGWRAGMRVRAIGKSTGTGKPLIARAFVSTKQKTL